MHVFELTRTLIDIESITDNEERVGHYLYDYLADLASQFGGRVERMEVEPRRFNVFAQWGEPLVVTLSTHLDTVPPFFKSREDADNIWGRGACDTKGIIASMIQAVEELLAAGERGFGLLFVVGEERTSAGAYRAAKTPRGSRYIINGEPTGNRLALGSKGSLRYEVAASGKMAHSAYPELGDSAIHKLIDVLADMRKIPFGDGAFDVVVSSQAIHNIYDAAGRAQAIGEIARVLAPGGRVLLRDIRHLGDYRTVLASRGVSDVRSLDSRLMTVFLALVTFGSLRPGTLLARKPA